MSFQPSVTILYQLFEMFNSAVFFISSFLLTEYYSLVSLGSYAKIFRPSVVIVKILETLQYVLL